jgi:hypothetical protein
LLAACRVNSPVAGAGSAQTTSCDHRVRRIAIGNHDRQSSIGTPTTTDHHHDHKWSADLTEPSDALDLEKDVFKSNDPKKIARSLKASAEHSHRRKAEPYRSAMSMVTFYINRAGKNLSAEERKTLEAAKPELRAFQSVTESSRAL